MSTALSTARPLPGSGILARSGDLLLLCADSARVDEVLDLFLEVAAAGSDGSVLVRRIAALLANDFDGSLPACAAAGAAADGRLAVLVYGTATAEVESDDGTTTLTGTDAVTSVNRLVNGPVTALRLQLPGAGLADHRTRLDAGVVPAAGVVVGGAEIELRRGSGTAGSTPAQDPPAPPATWPAPVPPVAMHEPEAAVAAEPQPAVPEPSAWPEPAPAGYVEPPALPRDEVVAAPQESALEESAQESAPQDSAESVAPAVAEQAPSESGHPYPESEHQRYAESPAGPDPVEVAEAPSGGPADEAAFVAVPLAPAAGVAGGLPLRVPAADARSEVVGVHCDHGHFNDPRRSECSVCGLALPQGTLAQQTGPRPSLGVLVLDDGTVFGLDAEYVLGREPQHDPEVTSGTARPLRVADADGIVSRRHARVALDGWDVLVVDLGSANGTAIEVPGETDPRPLAPHQPVAIAPGTRVIMGRRWFRYEALGRP